MPNPKINPVILLSPVEDGYVAYDPARDRLHQLNPIAALLAELCDGSRDIETLRDLAGPLMPDGSIGEIDRWIDEGIKAGLLIWDDTDNAPTISAKEVSRIALRRALFSFRRLGQTGEIHAALQSAKEAVRLDPADWDAWYTIGKIAQCLGHRDEARAAYQKYLDAYPENGEIEQVLVALRDDAPPPRVSDQAVRHIFGSFAAHYDSRMRDDLKFSGPEQIRGALTAVIGARAGLAVLDLGCGSGLAGAGVREFAAEMVGVDLSPEMIELARARNIYDRLEVAEITQWLDADGPLFDVIISCDCMIYFGDLRGITASAAKRLKPDGLIVISVERGELYPFRLAGTGRYTHHPRHIQEVAAECGLAVARMTEGFLRTEYGEEVMGLFAVLRFSEHSEA